MHRYLFLLLFLALFSCEKRDLPTELESNPAVVLEQQSIPTVVNPGRSYPLSVRLKTGNPADVSSIKLSITSERDNQLVAESDLYDDGAALHPGDGDVVAHDGVYSTSLLWSPPNNSRENYTFTFVPLLEQNMIYDALVITVTSLANLAPEIVVLEVPDVLESGFASAQFKAQVADSNGFEDIDKVLYKGVRNETLIFQGELLKSSTPANSTEAALFALTIDSTFAIGKKGQFRLVFEALDKSGEKSAPAEQNIFIHNKPPVLTDVIGPNVFERPNSGTDKFLLTVTASDEQSLADVKVVKLVWQKADGSYSANSPFTMYDNGLPFNQDFSGWDDGYRGDLVADDGIYSITALFDPSQPLGTYTLTMYAEDFAGNRSEEIIHTIKLKDDE